MSARSDQTTWAADPHTIAKIAILSKYLKAWFSIFGTTVRNEPILFIDGFAGPGEYKNGQIGSPIAAIEAANSVLSSPTIRWIAGDITCVFMEKDAKRFEHLERRLASVEHHPRLHPRALHCTFETGIQQVARDYSRSFSPRSPLFVFVDPFGATGVPFETLRQVLGSERSEVLINFDVDGAARILLAGEAASSEANLTLSFGNDIWRQAVDQGLNTPILHRRLLELYTERLRTIGGVRYVFPFEMRGKHDTLSYYLLFATGHPLGLKKMKESMRQIDQDGTYRFSSANQHQLMLFRYDEVVESARRMHADFVGQRISRPALDRFALEETGLLNATKMLRVLEKDGRIVVHVKRGASRRKFTYKEDVVKAIEFIERLKDA